MRAKTWKGVSPEAIERVRLLLLRRGGVEDPNLKNPYEAWRVRIDRSVFTGYRGGTIYANGGKLPELMFLYQSISDIVDGK
jgi:hypothetical protein